jgi:precorrin-8X/cobalt-precorrin-8 methylmutase
MRPPTRRYPYETSPEAIYRQSFATIRSEADLSSFSEDEATVAVRMIHACGDVTLAGELAFHPQLVAASRAALASGAPILTDAQMIASGVTRRRLPQDNEVLCLLADPRVPEW